MMLVGQRGGLGAHRWAPVAGPAIVDRDVIDHEHVGGVLKVDTRKICGLQYQHTALFHRGCQQHLLLVLLTQRSEEFRYAYLSKAMYPAWCVLWN